MDVGRFASMFADDTSFVKVIKVYLSELEGSQVRRKPRFELLKLNVYSTNFTSI